MINSLEAEDLKKLLEREQVIIIDVREQSEYDESNIEGSVLIPLGELSIEQVKKAANGVKKIVFQCRSGVRSLRACHIISEQDDTLELYNLEGGIIAWEAANKPE